MCGASGFSSRECGAKKLLESADEVSVELLRGLCAIGFHVRISSWGRTASDMSGTLTSECPHNSSVNPAVCSCECLPLAKRRNDLAHWRVEPATPFLGRYSESVADFIHAVVYGEKAVATFIAIVDVWPSGDFYLQIVGF